MEFWNERKLESWHLGQKACPRCRVQPALMKELGTSRLNELWLICGTHRQALVVEAVA